MIVRKIFYCLIIGGFIFSLRPMEDQDDTGEHPEMLIEDLANLTDLDLEFKDSDQLELLLLKIDRAIQYPLNDFDGQFNVPEITDHVNELLGSHYVPYNSKLAHLERLKQRIQAILKQRKLEHKHIA